MRDRCYEKMKQMAIGEEGEIWHDAELIKFRVVLDLDDNGRTCKDCILNEANINCYNFCDKEFRDDGNNIHFERIFNSTELNLKDKNGIPLRLGNIVSDGYKEYVIKFGEYEIGDGEYLPTPCLGYYGERCNPEEGLFNFACYNQKSILDIPNMTLVRRK